MTPDAAPAALLAPAEADAPVWRLHQPFVLGASLDLAIVSDDPAAALRAAQAARRQIDRLDAVLSRWRSDSVLSRGATAPELTQALAAAERWRELSGGAFDARTAAGWDLDGLAKGQIIDAALAAARRTPGVDGLLVDIGGDLAVWGKAPSAAGWRVGMAHPDRLQDNAAPAEVIRVARGGVAFSGPGLRGPHIRRPDGTLSTHSAAVVGPTARDADALATTLCAMPPGEGLALAERLEGFEALVHGPGGRVATSGWAALAEPRRIQTQASTPWPPGFRLVIDYEIPRQPNPRAQPPYLAVWITDKAGAPVRTLTLMGKDDRFIDQNFIWWRRIGRAIGQDAVDALAKPTRRPGRYSMTWDGRDDQGRPAPQGPYVVHMEASREHGGHGYQTFEVMLGAQPASVDSPGNDELGPARVSYGPPQTRGA